MVKYKGSVSISLRVKHLVLPYADSNHMLNIVSSNSAAMQNWKA